MVSKSWLAASILAASGVHAAEASTFTPDMWVYEISHAAQAYIGYIYGGAWTTAPEGMAVPKGCGASHMSEDGIGDIHISCDGVSIGALGINAMEGFNPQYGTGRIGFNEDGFQCTGYLTGFCPGHPGALIADMDMDYATGVASFDTAFWEGAYGRYSFSPDGGASMSGGDVAWLQGGWDYGYGGHWVSYGDVVFGLAGTGSLIQAPSIVPLPAPALMLLSALAAFAPGMVRRRARRWSEVAAPA